MTPLALTVNDRAFVSAVEPRTSLADFLRDTLDLTGTHLGCEHGVCGACTLLLDDAPARSCITYAVACGGAHVTTIEGLDKDEIASELRSAFTREHALQCGYCTPGMLISARDLVLRLPEPDEQSIRVGMSGNLCRCTGYVGIVRAICAVIADRRARGVAAKHGGGREMLGPVGSGHGISDATAGDASIVRSAAIDAPVSEAVAEIPDFIPAMVFEQSITVSHRPERVFALFGDIGAVAACLPGAVLSGMPTPQRAEGSIRVRVGPISASFEGAARIERNEREQSGRIVGIGNDRRSHSSTQGEILYRLTPMEQGAATRIDLTIGYSLRGILAQVGRPGLIRDIAQRLIAEFARSLDERLSGNPLQEPVRPAAELDGGSLVLGFLRDWIRRVLGLPNPP